MMNGREKSDSAIVAMKPANKAGEPAAEWVEPRGTRTSQTHAGRRTGQACHRGWNVYGKLQSSGRRSGSPHYCTMLQPTGCESRSMRSSAMRLREWTA